MTIATRVRSLVPGTPHWSGAMLERATLHEILMGAQDNLTNVLAVVLGVTIGSGRADLVALAGLSAGIAESVSMGGVLYNATRAEVAFEDRHSGGSEAISRDVGPRLDPVLSGVVTFVASMIAGLIPLIPFAFFPVSVAVIGTMILSVTCLFVLGALTGRVGGESWWREGIRLLLVAGLAAAAAAVVGASLHVG